MLLNIYFELTDEQFNKLFEFLGTNGIAFFNATEFDSYTNGPCALDSLKEIEADIEK